MTGHARLATFGAMAVAFSSLSLLPVIEGGWWFWLSLLGLALIAGTGEVCRQARLARPLIPFVQFGVLVCYLTSRLAGDEAILGFIPGGAAIAELQRVAQRGLEDINKYTAPVPESAGIVALTTAGVCLIGLLVDVLAVTLRRAALAGLPLLALYSVAAAVVKGGVSWIIFGIAGFGYLALLLTEGRDRVSQWGRPLRIATRDGRILDRRPPVEVETSPLTQVGRRIGAAALGLAIVVPALIPDVSGALFGGGGGFGGSGGSGRIVTSNPIASLKQDLSLPKNEPVLRITTNNPNAKDQYLRDASLDEFDGDEWRPSKPQLVAVPRPLPQPDGLSEEVRRTSVTTKIEVYDRLKSQWLLMPQPATDVNVRGRWRYDPRGRDIIGYGRQTTAGLTYQVTSLDLAPTAEQLDETSSLSEPMSRFLALPQLPAMVRPLVEQAVKGADTPYQQAVKLQNWFQDNFEYSTTVKSGHNTKLLEDFLIKRKGYCEQFATTMAVMARMLGIPSRVGVGFTAGQEQLDGTFIVKTHDRHAWPELYFEGVGWLRFEPTPSIDGTNGNGSTPSWARVDASGRPGGADDPSATDPTDPATTGTRCQGRFECDDREQSALQQPDASGGGGGGADGSFPVIPASVGGVALALLALPWLLRSLTRRRRRRVSSSNPEQYIRGAWAELRDLVLDFGLSWDPAETPRQMSRRLGREAALDTAATEALMRVARAAERLRFARTHGPVGDLFADVETVRAGLIVVTGRLARWRAVLLPPSSAALLTMAGGRVADLLDWVDATGARVRAALPRRQGARP